MEPSGARGQHFRSRVPPLLGQPSVDNQRLRERSGQDAFDTDTCGGKVLLLSGLKGVSVCVLVHQSCPTLCNPVHCSLPGSSVRGILQARILGWLAISFSRGSS